MQTTYISIILIILLIHPSVSITYPLFNQCDPKWKDQKLGTSTDTICKVGALVSAASMALAGHGVDTNPSVLNNWLKNNKGYLNKDDFIWAALNKFPGFLFEGKVSNSLLKINLDVGYVVIMNVNKGTHWVLATGYSGNTFFVNDSLNVAKKSYELSEIVSGNTGIYKVPTSVGVGIGINEIEQLQKMQSKVKNLIYQ